MKFFKRSAYFPREGKWLELTEEWAKDYFKGLNPLHALVATQEEADLLTGMSYMWGVTVEVSVADLSIAGNTAIEQTFIQMRIEVDH